MPDDPVIDALRAAVASETRTKPRKGDLQRWMRKRQAEIAELRADGYSWDQFAEAMNEHGMTNDHGGPVHAEALRSNWRKVQARLQEENRNAATPQSPEISDV